VSYRPILFYSFPAQPQATGQQWRCAELKHGTTVRFAKVKHRTPGRQFDVFSNEMHNDISEEVKVF
jgi:hypothetical protein